MPVETRENSRKPSPSVKALLKRLWSSKNLWDDVYAMKSVLLTGVCFTFSLIFLKQNMSYGITYFFVTIAWTFESFPVHFICLMIPIGLEVSKALPPRTMIRGYLLEDPLSLIVGSVFYFLTKYSYTNKKLVSMYLLKFPLLAHNQLFVCIFVTASLSTTCPPHLIIFLILSFVESFLEITKSADNRAYFSSLRKLSRHNQFDKAFKLAVAYSAHIGSTPSLVNSTTGDIIDKVLIQSGNLNLKTWYAITIPITMFNLIICWVVLLVVFLGIRFTKLCFISNYRAVRNIFYPRARDIRDNSFSDFTRQLKEMRRRQGELTWSDAYMIGVLASVIVLAITRKPFLIKGWSERILSGFFKVQKGDTKLIYFSLVVCVAIILLFIFPTANHISVRAEIPNNPDGNSITFLSPITNWNLLCQFIPWAAVLSVGASCYLFYGYQFSKVYYRISVGLAYTLGPEKDGITVIQMYLIALFLNMYNFSFIINYMMVPIAIHIARYKNTNVSEILLYSLLGTRCSFITPFSSKSNISLFFMTKNIKREDMLKAGVPLTIFCSISTLIYLNIFVREFDSTFDSSVLRYSLFKLIG